MKKIIIFKALLIILLVSFSAIAETPPESLFPDTSAGMSAYTQVDGIDESNNVFMLNKVQSFLGEQGHVINSSSNHIIGTLTVKIKVKDNDNNEFVTNSISVHIYFDTDGYLVAYLLRGEPSSRIIYWNEYASDSITTNVLEKSLLRVVEEIGNSHAPLKYYHFQYPTATNFSIIVDTASNLENHNSNYSVTIPGTVHEASYSSYYSPAYSDVRCSLRLTVDNTLLISTSNMLWCDGSNYGYNFYNNGMFVGNTPHSVAVRGSLDNDSDELRIGVGSFFLYEVE